MGITDLRAAWNKNQYRKTLESASMDARADIADTQEQEHDAIAPGYGVVAGALLGLILWAVIAIVWIAT